MARAKKNARDSRWKITTSRATVAGALSKRYEWRAYEMYSVVSYINRLSYIHLLQKKVTRDIERKGEEDKEEEREGL